MKKAVLVLLTGDLEDIFRLGIFFNLAINFQYQLYLYGNLIWECSISNRLTGLSKYHLWFLEGAVTVAE